MVYDFKVRNRRENESVSSSIPRGGDDDVPSSIPTGGLDRLPEPLTTVWAYVEKISGSSVFSSGPSYVLYVVDRTAGPGRKREKLTPIGFWPIRSGDGKDFHDKDMVVPSTELGTINWLPGGLPYLTKTFHLKKYTDINLASVAEIAVGLAAVSGAAGVGGVVGQKVGVALDQSRANGYTALPTSDTGTDLNPVSSDGNVGAQSSASSIEPEADTGFNSGSSGGSASDPGATVDAGGDNVSIDSFHSASDAPVEFEDIPLDSISSTDVAPMVQFGDYNDGAVMLTNANANFDPASRGFMSRVKEMLRTAKAGKLGPFEAGGIFLGAAGGAATVGIPGYFLIKKLVELNSQNDDAVNDSVNSDGDKVVKFFEKAINYYEQRAVSTDAQNKCFWSTPILTYDKQARFMCMRGVREGVRFTIYNATEVELYSNGDCKAKNEILFDAMIKYDANGAIHLEETVGTYLAGNIQFDMEAILQSQGIKVVKHRRGAVDPVTTVQPAIDCSKPLPAGASPPARTAWNSACGG